MKVYKGSRFYLSPFEPQIVHPDDYHKFPIPTPKGIIFATDREIKAKIFAVFSGISTFSSGTTNINDLITVKVDRMIKGGYLDEKVYIYEFETESNDWKYLEKSSEWYTTKEQIPLNIQEYTRGELYKELKENKDIILLEEQEFIDRKSYCLL